MKTYKVGIIGLGQIAYSIDKDPTRKIIWSYIKAYQKLDNIEIISVCDLNFNLVKSIQSECCIPKGYTNYNLMLESEELDIVSICTPIQTHYDIIKSCVKNNVKAIFCEKTLCYSVDEANEIIEICHKNNVFLTVNYIQRWDYLNNEIKNLLQNNLIGKIYTIVGYGATALYTSTSHLIDLILYLSNSNPIWVVGDLQTDFIRKVHGISDYGGIGMIKFDSGAVGFIKGVSESPNKYMLELDIIGELGRIKLINNGNTLEIYQYQNNDDSTGSNYQSLVLIKSQERNFENERMLDAINEIIYCLENNLQTRSNGLTAIQSIKIIEAIKDSYNRKQTVLL